MLGGAQLFHWRLSGRNQLSVAQVRPGWGEDLWWAQQFLQHSLQITDDVGASFFHDPSGVGGEGLSRDLLYLQPRYLHGVVPTWCPPVRAKRLRLRG